MLGSKTGAAARLLFADLAAHFPLTAEQWRWVPLTCAGLGCALPAVLARSYAEASQPVRRLPAADQQRPCTAALCLARAQHRWHVRLLGPLLRAILAQRMDG